MHTSPIIIFVVLPIIPVIVSVGIRYDDYGVTDSNGNLTL